jgi:hypothetical protein
MVRLRPILPRGALAGLALASLVLAPSVGCDPGRAPRDGGGAGVDVAYPPGVDAYIPPGTDAHVELPPDAYVPPGVDAGPPAPDAAVPPIAFCRIGCAAPADCATAGVALYDASHYACEAGLCRWTGCRADDECRAVFMRADYACRDVGGLAQCVQTCATATDCGSGTAAFDGDNYECRGGVCTYTGCRDDVECAATFSSSRYVCRRASLPDTGLPIPTAERNCVLGCASASDCAQASGAFDADNYTCSAEGACVYAGCRDDAECCASFMADRYVCR